MKVMYLAQLVQRVVPIEASNTDEGKPRVYVIAIDQSQRYSSISTVFRYSRSTRDPQDEGRQQKSTMGHFGRHKTPRHRLGKQNAVRTEFRFSSVNAYIVIKGRGWRLDGGTYIQHSVSFTDRDSV